MILKRMGWSVLVLVAVLSCAKEKEAPIDKPPVEDDQDPPTDGLGFLDFDIVEAPEWNAVFKRTSGWLGADGIYSIPQNRIDTPGNGKQTETLLIFSDTMVGEVEDGILQNDMKIVNNTVAWIQPGVDMTTDRISFVWENDQQQVAAQFVPSTPKSAAGEYYWLGDAFVNAELGDKTYIFGYRMRTIGEGAFGFAEFGNSLIVLPKGSRPPFADAKQMDTPLLVEGKTPAENYSYGGGIFMNTESAGAPDPDGFVYIYGVKNVPFNKELKVARVLPAEFEDFGKWRFWDGEGWGLGISDIANAQTITDRVSNELSLTPLPDGRYALVFQIDAISKSIGVRLSERPEGPFGPIIKLYDCPEVRLSNQLLVYNAKAHPHLSAEGELLISYNINSADFADIISKPNFFHPRFIKLLLK